MVIKQIMQNYAGNEYLTYISAYSKNMKNMENIKKTKYDKIFMSIKTTVVKLINFVKHVFIRSSWTKCCGFDLHYQTLGIKLK